MNGWLRLHRQLLEWEWYSCMKTTRVFIHLLLSATWKDARWQGVEIPRGSVFASPETLAAATGLSRQQVRTIITRLKSTSEITTKATNKGTLITLCNFDTYNPLNPEINQQDNQQDNNSLTIDQPALNQGLTTSKEGKEDNKEKKETSCSASTDESAKAKRGPIWSQETGWEGIEDSDLSKWRDAFPACDIRRQLAAMSIWLEGNPAKARKSNWRRFISAWLTKSQDKGGDISGGFSPTIEFGKPKAPSWLPENWKEIAAKVTGTDVSKFTSHADIPAQSRFRFEEACRGRIDLDEPELDLSTATFSIPE